MTKLIDADALMEALKNGITTHRIQRHRSPDLIYKAYDELVAAITNAPNIQREEQDKLAGWVSVEDRLPSDSKCVLAIVLDKNNLKGWHWEIVNYGSFSFYDANGNSPDADEDGEVQRFGWHYGRESEGEYDYLIFDLKDKVTHWQPLTLPAAPKE